MKRAEKVEALARLLCLACNENPDATEVHTNRVRYWEGPPLWKRKYKTTAERLLTMGVDVGLELGIKAKADR